jgi:hypothetical protein
MKQVSKLGQNSLSQTPAEMMRFASPVCATPMKDDSARQTAAKLFLDKRSSQEQNQQIEVIK